MDSFRTESNIFVVVGTIACKINGTIKGVYLPISKQHSILAVANILNYQKKEIISQIYFCCQISLLCAAVNCSVYDNLTPLGGNINFAGDGTSGSYNCILSLNE